MKSLRYYKSGKGDIVSQNIGGNTQQNINKTYKQTNIKNENNKTLIQKNNNKCLIGNSISILYNKNITDNRKFVVNNISITQKSVSEINYNKECDGNYIYLKDKIKKAISYAKREDINETFEYLKSIQIKGVRLKTEQYVKLKDDLDVAFEILKDRKSFNRQKQIEYKIEKSKEQKYNYRIFKEKIKDIMIEIKYNNNLKYLKDKLKTIELKGYSFEKDNYDELKKEINNLWNILKQRENKYK